MVSQSGAPGIDWIQPIKVRMTLPIYQPNQQLQTAPNTTSRLSLVCLLGQTEKTRFLKISLTRSHRLCAAENKSMHYQKNTVQTLEHAVLMPSHVIDVKMQESSEY